MAKVSPKDGQHRNTKQRRRSRSSSNKYLRPGALAQLRYSKAAAAAKSCTDLGKKRVAVIDQKEGDNETVLEENIMDKSPMFVSPVRFADPPNGSHDVLTMNNLQKTPKTPSPEEHPSESRLESLPEDILVKILCHLHHDQLRAVFHVSRKIRKAVIVARQFHFNYTTPDRSRQEMLRTMTPLPTDHWPFISNSNGNGKLIASPHTPKAPKHAPRPPRGKYADIRPIPLVLFQESAFPSRCLVPSVLSKRLLKSMGGSNRVLFYEDELCQAVAQNKLR